MSELTLDRCAARWMAVVTMVDSKIELDRLRGRSKALHTFKVDENASAWSCRCSLGQLLRSVS